MRIKFLIAGMAIASTAIASFLNPAATAASSPEGAGDPVVASCASPPATPDATEDNRDRYVELWSARFADRAWLTDFAALDTVPAEILDEGFHGMDAETQLWLNSCLLEDLLAGSGETPGAKKLVSYLSGLNLVVFGKAELAQLRDELTEMPPSEDVEPLPVQQDMTSEALEGMTEELATEPSLTPADQPEAQVTTPTTRTTAATPPSAVTPNATPTALLPSGGLLAIPPIPQLLKAVNDLLALVSKIQGQLFTLPGLNLLASLFYKVCAESPTMPLSCSVSLPVGVPIPADVTGDNFPDVITGLVPQANLITGSVGARFQVQRLFPSTGPLPAHVFAVYDTPFVKKRIEFGYDGRASTLARNSVTNFTLKNALNALTGDIEVAANVTNSAPGSTESLTFAVKSLVGGSAGVPPTEADPMVGSVQMSPFPEAFNVNAHLIHTPGRDQDIFTVGSSTPTKVNALIDQSTTTTTPQSNRRFTAEVDKLPTSVTVDLVRNGETQSIDYTGSAPIDHVRASDTATPDVSHPGSFTESIYDVKGVPTNVHVDLKGAEDITYSASAKIPEVSFSTRTLTDDVLQQQITAKAHEIPQSVHITNLTTDDKTAFTYDADSELQDVELTMYDLNDDKTNLVAKATGIPTDLAFTQTKSTGVYEFSAPGGIDLIEASLTRNDGMLLPLPGDHATVHKVGDALGLDFRLSGFESARFDGSEDTTLELGLDPGGQSFDAIADLDDPNVLATAHVSNLPTELAVTISPSDQSVNYTASSVVSSLTGSFLLRDTGDELDIAIEDIPTSIAMSFDGTGSTMTWDASGNTGLVSADAHLTPATLGGVRDFDASVDISSIPQTWDASWAAGNVLFEAPAPGIGSVDVRVTNHGMHHVLAGDHLSAFFDQTSGDLDASLHISNLQKAAFTKLTTGDGGGFEAGLKMGNHGIFRFAADITATSGIVKASGQFSNLPADLTLRSDGGRITYTGDSNPDLTVAVEAGATAAALAATPAPNTVHGVSVRDGADGANRAVKANLFLTGLPTSLDLNSPAGTYKVGGYHPSNDTLVVDVVLTTIAPKDVSLQAQQVVPTVNPVDFTFGPFTSTTAGDGTHSLSLDYVASEELGSLTAEVIYGDTDDAKLVISSIPKSVAVDAAFGASQKSVNVDMDDGIDEITASYKKAGEADFAASVKLTDVPKWVNLLLGRATASDGTTDISTPDFTFTAFEPGLDIEAMASAEIATPADVKAEAELMVTNLGHTVTGALNGMTLNIASTPATEKFLLAAAGSVKLGVDLGFDLVGGFIHNTGSLDVDIDIKKLTLGFENASTLQLDLGITTGLKGDYSSFTFAEDTKTVITIQDTLKLVADLPDIIGDLNFTVIDIPPTPINFENVISSFRLASNRLDVAFSQTLIDIICCSVKAQLLVRPHSEFSSNGPAFTVPQPPADGNPPAWLITPNPNVLGVSLPDFVVDVVAYFTSPYGHDLEGRLLCNVPIEGDFDCTPSL